MCIRDSPKSHPDGDIQWGQSYVCRTVPLPCTLSGLSPDLGPADLNRYTASNSGDGRVGFADADLYFADSMQVNQPGSDLFGQRLQQTPRGALDNPADDFYRIAIINCFSKPIGFRCSRIEIKFQADPEFLSQRLLFRENAVVAVAGNVTNLYQHSHLVSLH